MPSMTSRLGLRVGCALLGAALMACTAGIVGAADEERILPPPGIKIPKEDTDRLQSEVARLKTKLADFERTKPAYKISQLIPDAGVLIKAVDYALREGSFYDKREIPWADAQLKLAAERIDALADNKHPWTEAHGLVVRGFRSSLDDSPQPYGLVIPDDLDLSKPAPLYVWLHGRGDKTVDLQFIQQRLTSAGQIRPAGAIVLHPFGRYCNGYKFAGGVDVHEAIIAVLQQYAIDRDRIVLIGFSMGGAGVWHLGAHYPQWTAISPGAGFVDVRRYQNLSPEKFPPWYEQTLWNLYDVPEYARNLLNVPLVAYSGELDKQKQAADIMEETLKREGLTMTHIIGPGVAHKYEPKALADVMARLKVFEQQGVNLYPAEVHLQTRTLRYGGCFWITATGLEEHWRDSRIDAVRKGQDRVEIKTQNVTRLKMDRPWPEPPAGPVTVEIDGQSLSVDTKEIGGNFEYRKRGTRWELAHPRGYEESEFRKKPRLQGPIDDAFERPFLVVRPTGKSAHPAVDKWVQSEMARFRERWRLLFRGEVREADDVDVIHTEKSRKYNLILWGDPSSNKLLAQIADKLPIKWDAKSIRAGEKSWPAESHVLTMIHPNPLDSVDPFCGGGHTYVVLNSGMTFREADDRTNSLQNPKLPDWAVFDLATPPDSHAAGRVADAGFFDEQWKYKAARAIPGAPAK
jgi:hypothetical protein